MTGLAVTATSGAANACGGLESSHASEPAPVPASSVRPHGRSPCSRSMASKRLSSDAAAGQWWQEKTCMTESAGLGARTVAFPSAAHSCSCVCTLARLGAR